MKILCKEKISICRKLRYQFSSVILDKLWGKNLNHVILFWQCPWVYFSWCFMTKTSSKKLDPTSRNNKTQFLTNWSKFVRMIWREQSQVHWQNAPDIIAGHQRQLCVLLIWCTQETHHCSVPHAQHLPHFSKGFREKKKQTKHGMASGVLKMSI